MFTAALLAFVLQQLDGLRSGESVLGSSQEVDASDRLRGRVLDGATGVPIAGAEVELWREEHDLTASLLGKALTRVDGSFVGPSPKTAEERARPPDKLIVRAAGHRSTCASSSDAGEIALLPLAKHLGLRVVDLDGNPIAGARAESRQTCAHAPPAFVATSNASGVFDMSTFPPLDDHPELVVGARGYGSIFLGFSDPMLAPGGLEVRLPKRKPLVFRLVDSSGRALSKRLVHAGVEPHWRSFLSDAEGRISIDTTFYDRQFHLTIADGGESAFLAAGRAPISFEPTLTYYSREERTGQGSASTASVPVHVVDAQQRAVDVPIVVVPSKGTTPDGLESRRLEVNQGPATLIAGGPFTGWKETVTVLEKPVETTLVVTREPVLTIQLPAETYWLLHVQAGDDSITLDNPKFPLKQPVPAGKAITICAVNEKETRLAALGHIDEDRAVDMTRTASVIQQPRVPEPAVAHRWTIDEPELGGHVRLATGQIDWSDLKGAVEFTAEPRASFEAIVSAGNCVPRTIGPWNAAETSFKLPHRGSVTVHGASLSAVFAGGQRGEALEAGGIAVTDLAPGPLLMELLQKDVGVITVSIVLADGEQRELTLK